MTGFIKELKKRKGKFTKKFDRKTKKKQKTKKYYKRRGVTKKQAGGAPAADAAREERMRGQRAEARARKLQISASPAPAPAKEPYSSATWKAVDAPLHRPFAKRDEARRVEAERVAALKAAKRAAKAAKGAAKGAAIAAEKAAIAAAAAPDEVAASAASAGESYARQALLRNARIQNRLSGTSNNTDFLKMVNNSTKRHQGALETGALQGWRLGETKGGVALKKNLEGAGKKRKLESRKKLKSKKLKSKKLKRCVRSKW